MTSRRKFISKAFLTTAGIGLAKGSTLAKEDRSNLNKPFKSAFAPHFGMFRHSAGNSHIDQIQFMYDRGFRALEDNGMMGRSVEEQKAIASKMEKLGMRMGVFVVGFDSWPPKTTLASGDIKWKEHFLKTCREAVEVAKRVNAKWMTVVPGNFDRTLPMGIQTANVIDALRRATDIFEPHGLTMVLEPLSDNPDLFMRYSDQTYLLCKAVNSPACKILFDMWHMQRNEGRLQHHMDLTYDEIGYFQIGDEPGRKEPTTGEINYKHLFKHIYEKSGDQLILGMEHGNAFDGKEGEEKLIAAYRWCDDF
ncbi:hydroxypyruvate isomerase family protein [Jiulongibacter sp. NS-SX5]|uniref:hydroxypyruvate isomerase family protein n=1 Tax=Jiulongibacter sp. NS-SX5 TaxID=3463854 RepID=UPI004059DEE0